MELLIYKKCMTYFGRRASPRYTCLEDVIVEVMLVLWKEVECINLCVLRTDEHSSIMVWNFLTNRVPVDCSVVPVSCSVC
jgi:hypothetical protein